MTDTPRIPDEALADRVDDALASFWSGSVDDFDRLIDGDDGGEGGEGGLPVAATVRDAIVQASHAVTGLDMGVGGRTEIGAYRIVRQIGAGGMGVVYEAESEVLHRTVALKVMRMGRFADEAHQRLFQREIESLARLKHPNIAAIYEAGETDDGNRYFAMEHVPGVTLIEFAEAADGTPLDRRGRLHLFRKVCDAIHYAHQRGVIHRDLKPSNIIVDPANGEPKVLDFGLAQLTDSDITLLSTAMDAGKVLGTLPYMSPEQARGQTHDVDVRSDVYSLGVILYELLTGRLPYDVSDRSVPSAIDVICQRPPARPGDIERRLRGDLETIMLKALDKEPEARYAGAAALSEDVQSYLAGHPIAARPHSAAYQLRKLIIRQKLPFALLGLLVVAAVVGSVWLSVLYLRAVEAEQVAAAETERAVAQADKAQRVTQFLTETLAAVDPSTAGRSTVSLRYILDQAAQRIDDELGEQPLSEATVRHAMGQSYMRLGQNDQARAHLETALDIRTRELGATHPDTLATHGQLAVVFRYLGQYADAEAAYLAVLDHHRAQSGDEEMETLETINNLAELYIHLGRYERAEKILDELLEIVSRLWGPGDGKALTVQHNLASVLFKLGRYDEAAAMYDETLAHRRSLLGDDHTQTLSTRRNQARVYGLQGDHDRAESVLGDVLAVQRRVLGDEHRETFATMKYLALVYLESDRPAQAEPILAELIELKRRGLPEDHSNLAEALVYLGQCMTRQRRFDEAERAIAEAWAMLERAPAAPREPMVRAAQAGIELYEAWGRSDDAHLWHRRMSEVDEMTDG